MWKNCIQWCDLNLLVTWQQQNIVLILMNDESNIHVRWSAEWCYEAFWQDVFSTLHVTEHVTDFKELAFRKPDIFCKWHCGIFMCQSDFWQVTPWASTYKCLPVCIVLTLYYNPPDWHQYRIHWPWKPLLTDGTKPSATYQTKLDYRLALTWRMFWRSWHL